jgi:hypothetical protein
MQWVNPDGIIWYFYGRFVISVSPSAMRLLQAVLLLLIEMIVY